jgi:hypothetical protein
VLAIPLTVFGMSVLMQVSLSAGVNLMLDEDYLNLSTVEASVAATNMLIQPIPIQFLFLIVGGIMYDSVGKRVTIFSNMLLVSLTAYLAPYCTNIYPEYFLDRVMLASCSIIVMMNPLVNAYIK